MRGAENISNINVIKSMVVFHSSDMEISEYISYISVINLNYLLSNQFLISLPL